MNYSLYFDAISDGTNITKTKPDPEVFIKATEFISEKPADCIVIEDAEAGINAAVAGKFAGQVSEVLHIMIRLRTI